MGYLNENGFKCSGSHDQDGLQAHIWKKKTSKLTFFGTKRQTTLKLGLQHRVLKCKKFVQMMAPG